MRGEGAEKGDVKGVLKSVNKKMMCNIIHKLLKIAKSCNVISFLLKKIYICKYVWTRRLGKDFRFHFSLRGKIKFKLTGLAWSFVYFGGSFKTTRKSLKTK